MDGVVEESDGVADDAADNFSSHEAERGGHGPAEDAGAEGRVLVAVMAVTATV
jgi:hypothetical protein